MPDSPAPSLLPRDNIRSAIAAAIVLLTVGGWIYALTIPEDRFALSAQTRLWWIEQGVGLAVASACVGILLRKRSFLVPTFWLTVYSLLFDLMRWLLEFTDGQLRVPVALFLYALLLWRLRIARRSTAPPQDVPVV